MQIISDFRSNLILLLRSTFLHRYSKLSVSFQAHQENNTNVFLILITRDKIHVPAILAWEVRYIIKLSTHSTFAPFTCRAYKKVVSCSMTTLGEQKRSFPEWLI